jgi:hypothetical protein
LVAAVHIRPEVFMGSLLTRELHQGILCFHAPLQFLCETVLSAMYELHLSSERQKGK